MQEVYCILALTFDIIYARWFYAAFMLVHAILLVYALVVFIGLQPLWDDLTQ